MFPDSVMIIIYDYLSQMYMLDLKKEIRRKSVIKKILRIEQMGSCVIDRNLVMLMDYIYNKKSLQKMFDNLDCSCCAEHQRNVPCSVDHYSYPRLGDNPTKCKCPCRRYKRRIVEAYRI